MGGEREKREALKMRCGMDDRARFGTATRLEGGILQHWQICNYLGHARSLYNHTFRFFFLFAFALNTHSVIVKGC